MTDILVRRAYTLCAFSEGKKSEIARIESVARYLADLGFVLYSGNTCGAEIAAQVASKHRCVLYLPWDGFNREHYHASQAIGHIVKPTMEAIANAPHYHAPMPVTKITQAEAHLARVEHQVLGWKDRFSAANFVVTLGKVDIDGRRRGNPGQAWRIAEEWKIPTVDLRDTGWEKHLRKVVDHVLRELLLETNKQAFDFHAVKTEQRLGALKKAAGKTRINDVITEDVDVPPDESLMEAP